MCNCAKRRCLTGAAAIVAGHRPLACSRSRRPMQSPSICATRMSKDGPCVRLDLDGRTPRMAGTAPSFCPMSKSGSGRLFPRLAAPRKVILLPSRVSKFPLRSIQDGFPAIHRLHSIVLLLPVCFRWVCSSNKVQANANYRVFCEQPHTHR